MEAVTKTETNLLLIGDAVASGAEILTDMDVEASNLALLAVVSKCEAATISSKVCFSLK
jgi:hypothetical protein